MNIIYIKMTEQEDKVQHEINQKLSEMENDLKRVETYIYELETRYLESTSTSGNIIKGWDKIFASHKITNPPLGIPKKVKPQKCDRLFSSTSATIHHDSTQILYSCTINNI